MPEATLMVMGDKGPEPVTTGALFKGKRVVLFGVPGAFTPTCSNQHLPGFVRQAAAIKAKGVAAILCMAVNDAFVMDAWGKAQGVGTAVTMLADGNGALTQMLGVTVDARNYGMGERCKRFAMIVKDGVVEHVTVETNPGQAVESGADNILGLLG